MGELMLREMKLDDYEAIFDLWENTLGLGLSDADSKENIAMFLSRNNGLSFVAENDSKIIGTIMCGHDGRRGFIYHLAVKIGARRKGIGRKLVEHSLAKLKEAGITKCHLFALTDNSQAIKFWADMGFSKREDIHIFSKNINSR